MHDGDLNLPSRILQSCFMLFRGYMLHKKKFCRYLIRKLKFNKKLDKT